MVRLLPPLDFNPTLQSPPPNPSHTMQYTLRADWEEVKDEIMYVCVKAKFEQVRVKYGWAECWLVI